MTGRAATYAEIMAAARLAREEIAREWPAWKRALSARLTAGEVVMPPRTDRAVMRRLQADKDSTDAESLVGPGELRREGERAWSEDAVAQIDAAESEPPDWSGVIGWTVDPRERADWEAIWAEVMESEAPDSFAGLCSASWPCGEKDCTCIWRVDT